jgi:hypothetical protein
MKKMKYLLFFGVMITVYLGTGSPFNAVDSGDDTIVEKKTDDTLKYIFLGHTYRYNNPGPWHRLDLRVENLDYTPFQRIWLGGDISSEATLERGTMEYLDSVFDLSSPRVQYALGNHDIRNGNIQYYRELTGRNSYNVYSEHGVVSVCMNSQLNPTQCEDLNKQFQMIKNVCDTIQNSSHLFIMMHSCLFADVPNLPPAGTYAHTNYRNWNANCSSSTETFASAIYPMLEAVKEKGIIVYVMMGDTGTSSKQFHQASADSINFFASGIGNSKYTDPAILALQPLDRVLVFEHVLATQEMSWSFQDLDSLFNAQ